MKIKSLALGVVAAACLAAVGPAQAIPVELGIAIDGSGSIGSTNFNTQRGIYASVLNDPTILPRDGSIAVGVNVFSSSLFPLFPVTVIDETSIGNLIAAINGFNFPSGGTNIGIAIDALTADIFGNDIDSDRQVIDVSTDGFGGLGTSVADAQAAGIEQINCLGIGAGANCSFIPEGSFAVNVAGFDDLENALRQKILTETGGGGGGVDVPAPGALLLFALGLVGIGVGASRRHRKTH